MKIYYQIVFLFCLLQNSLFSQISINVIPGRDSVLSIMPFSSIDISITNHKLFSQEVFVPEVSKSIFIKYKCAGDSTWGNVSGIGFADSNFTIKIKGKQTIVFPVHYYFLSGLKENTEYEFVVKYFPYEDMLEYRYDFKHYDSLVNYKGEKQPFFVETKFRIKTETLSAVDHAAWEYLAMHNLTDLYLDDTVDLSDKPLDGVLKLSKFFQEYSDSKFYPHLYQRFNIETKQLLKIK